MVCNSFSILRYLASLVCFVLLSCHSVGAACWPAPHSVDFKTEGGRPYSARLNSFLCFLGDAGNTATVRVEFNRFSDGAASALVERVKSPILRLFFGDVNLVDNDVARAYRALVDQFGSVPNGDFNTPHISLNGDYWVSQETTQRVKTLTGVPASDSLYLIPYPAAKEIRAVFIDKILPPDLFYFLWLPDIPDVSDKYASITFWRPMTEADVDNYADNVHLYDELVASIRNDSAGRQTQTAPAIKTSRRVPNVFLAMKYIAHGNWPKDFLLIHTSSAIEYISRKLDTHGDKFCGPDLALTTNFEVAVPQFEIDTVSIENVSLRTVSLDSVIGWKSSNSTLRRDDGSDARESIPDTANLKLLLPPGKKVLYPLAIRLVPNDPPDEVPREDANWLKLKKASETLEKKIPSLNIELRESNHVVPSRKTYLYGPSATVDAIVINGTRFSFDDKIVNLADMIVSSEGLSCPFLLHQTSADADWTDDGKILTHAHGESHAGEEHKSFGGFLSAIRIAEREPETAYVHSPRVVVILTSGTRIDLSSTIEPIKAGDRLYRLHWGEFVDWRVRLPRGVTARQVATTEVIVRGYYDRDATILQSALALRRP
jgi:hypothetical protein